MTGWTLKGKPVTLSCPQCKHGLDQMPPTWNISIMGNRFVLPWSNWCTRDCHRPGKRIVWCATCKGWMHWTSAIMKDV